MGDFGRFRTPEQLVSYLGLNARVKQSGGKAANHGRTTKNGRAHARRTLVEAALTASKTPGSLRAFYQRVRARRGTQIAIVATARKLVWLCWTMIELGEDYAFARVSLTDKKLGALELLAGIPAHRGAKATPPTTHSKKPAAASRPWQVGPGRRQRDATKGLCGASCAAGRLCQESFEKEHHDGRSEQDRC